MTYISEQSSPLRGIPTSPESRAGHAAENLQRRPASSMVALVERIAAINARHAATVLRAALALVFVWFGALKMSGDSPVRKLIASTLPFIDPDVSIPVLGGVEIALGLVLAIGVFKRITLLVLAGHLMGTFLAFITASELMIQHGTPWQLTADGEFVVKNLILISAAFVLISYYSKGTAASTGD
jgi:putative oxidoreductase